MKVFHIVNKLNNTSIPVEIATEINQIGGYISTIGVCKPYEEIPDTTDRKYVEYIGDKEDSFIVDQLVLKGYQIVNTHHCAFSQKSLSIARLAQKRGIFWVDSQHGRSHYSFDRIVRNLESLWKADGITYNSHETEKSYNYAEKLLIGRKPTKVIQLGVDETKVKLIKSKNNHKSKKIVITSRLILRKNHEAALDAFSILKDRNYELTIIGSGAQEQALKKKTEDLRINEKVTFLGNIKNRADVYRVMNENDIFLLTSLAEGFCLAVAEAMMLRLPLVISNIPIFKEVTGQYARFVDPRNPIDIADKLEQVFRNYDETIELTEKAYYRANSHYTLKNTASNFALFYQKLKSSPDV